MKNWMLFFLGTLAYFLNRYLNRKVKIKEPSLIYWGKDNWPELLFSLVFDLAIMFIFMDPETVIIIDKITWMPEWLILPTKLIGSFLIGYGGGLGVYKIFKKKVKYEIDKK